MIALKSAEAKSKNREFTVEEAKAILDKGTSQPKTLGALDTLVFFTVASGASKETCQGFDAEVRQGERRLEPVQKDVELPTKNPTGIYYALYRLYFPLAKLDATGPVTLVMRSPLGEEWSYEFDLGKSR
jgi:hypothetical protein